MVTSAEMDRRFNYHKPTDWTEPVHEQIRGLGRALATYVDARCHDSRETSLALTKIEEAVMWANASVARNGIKEDVPGEAGG